MIDIGGAALLRAAAEDHGRRQPWSSTRATTAPGRSRPQGKRRRHQRGAAPGARGQGVRADRGLRRRDRPLVREPGGRDLLPERLVLGATRRQSMRYGENPHQKAAFCLTDAARPSVAAAEQVQGTALSYDDLARRRCRLRAGGLGSRSRRSRSSSAPSRCGVAIGADLARAYERALACDPQSAYGGVVALDRRLDQSTAEQDRAGVHRGGRGADGRMLRPGRCLLLQAEPPRLLLSRRRRRAGDRASWSVRSVIGGLLLQERDASWGSPPTS